MVLTKKIADFSEIFGVQSVSDPPCLLDLLKGLFSAIRDHRVVKIEFEQEPGKPREEREIEPYFMFFTGDFWYVHAWCRTKKGQRTFALDKIRSWKLTERYFVPRKDVPSVEEIREAFGPYVDEEPQEVIVRFGPEVKQYLLRRIWMKDQKCQELSDGWLEVRFKVRGLSGFKYWLYRWLPHFQVVAPDSLRDEIREDLRLAAIVIETGKESVKSGPK